LALPRSLSRGALQPMKHSRPKLGRSTAWLSLPAPFGVHTTGLLLFACLHALFPLVQGNFLQRQRLRRRSALPEIVNVFPSEIVEPEADIRTTPAPIFKTVVKEVKNTTVVKVLVPAPAPPPPPPPPPQPPPLSPAPAPPPLSPITVYAPAGAPGAAPSSAPAVRTVVVKTIVVPPPPARVVYPRLTANATPELRTLAAAAASSAHQAIHAAAVIKAAIAVPPAQALKDLAQAKYALGSANKALATANAVQAQIDELSGGLKVSMDGQMNGWKALAFAPFPVQ